MNPERGEHEHGDVEFADPTNKKYPVDTPEHVRAAWSYINHADNAAKYAKDEVETIKGRIKRAAKKHGVEIAGRMSRAPTATPKGPRPLAQSIAFLSRPLEGSGWRSRRPGRATCRRTGCRSSGR